MKRIITAQKASVNGKTAKQQSIEIPVAKAAKSPKIKPVVSAPNNASSAKKTKTVSSAEQISAKKQKPKPSVSVPNTQTIKKQIVEVKTAAKPPVKTFRQAVIQPKVKASKPPPAVSVTSEKMTGAKLKVNASTPQITLLPEAKADKSKQVKSILPQAKIVITENINEFKKVTRSRKTPQIPIDKAVENIVEPQKLPRVSKPKKKKAKPICSAIFRGKKDRYGFEVFPLDAELEDVSAIYVISKRKIDKSKKGHHALVCIGQTDSVLGEIKRHKKGKCVKKYQANVISILPEADEKKRLRIETDLKAAHAIVCSLE